MSHQINRDFQFWKSVEFQVRSGLSSLDQHPLSDNDKDRIANAYVLWALITKDLYGNGYPRECSDAALSSWIKRLSYLDISLVKNDLDTCLTLIRLWQPHMGSHGKRSFKRYAESLGCQLSSETFTPIRRQLYEFAVSFKGFKSLNIFLQFISRLTLKDVDWIEEEALQEYISFEKEIVEWDYDPDILSELRHIIREDFSNFVMYPLPDHGNGATAEVKRGQGREKKILKSLITPRLNHYLGIHTEMQHPCITNYSNSMATAKVQFVPKGIKKKRTICMEPSLNQYLQKSLAYSLDKLFQRNPHMKINLHNQEFNRILALEGSKRLELGTIDLSAASDSVSWRLVSSIFRDTPIWKDLFLLRSTHASLPDGNTIALGKFAPMGSALCFPIECIVFSAVVRCAQQRVGVRSKFRVYGDDIVVHSSCADETVRLLESLHFKVNDDKSFLPGSCFTESCGIECYQGVNVTPIRLSRFFDIVNLKDVNNHTAIEGAIELINDLFDRGFYYSRRYLLRLVREYYPELSFSEDRSFGIVSYTSSNYHVKCRYNKDLHRHEKLVSVLTSKVSNGSDDIRYQETLRAYSTTKRRSLAKPEDLISVKIGPTIVSRKRRYVPVE